MKKLKAYILGLAALPVGIILAVASPVGAATALDLGDGILVARGAAVDLPATITCDAGSTAYVSTELVQRVGNQIARGFGYSDAISCTGGTQVVELSITAYDKPFHKGEAVANGYLTTCTTFTCTSLQHQEIVTLVKK